MSGRVPNALRLVESFLNSVDAESGRDELGSLAGFHTWLAIHQRGAVTITVSEEERQLAGELRVALRARVAAEGAWLAPAAAGVLGVLGEILSAVVLADHDGSLRRLKICRAERCQVAFYDWSKNASRCWCSMQTCGNRNKTKAYRGRRREAAHSINLMPTLLVSNPSEA
jgi:hypothetical protein